ncbi:hypothetical protein BRADI_4g02231v3 [Brachypodium distachyon]|uniref:Wall-associated receptor kinase galacturonan-binding domain-containing protein n=1 Tax=Brachypodium distachyon TaxID=15368 RepID=A0A2K2CJZ3_BRADI|nr:hypothetical protein BRADI_4g02231v3 [Brachypodium distachyon]
MHLIFLLLVSLFLNGTAAWLCDRQCGGGRGSIVPRPFGFSAGCPVVLSCDVTHTSMPFLPYRGGGGDDGAATSYRVIAFNSTASTFLVTVPPSCTRDVYVARSELSGTNYGVSSRTGLFLHGGGRCGASGNSKTACSLLPADIMPGLLRAAQCGAGENGNESSTAAVACVASATPKPNNTTGVREDLFLGWEKTEKANCDGVLTAAVYGGGVASPEVGVAELGWWLDGPCAGKGAVSCAAAATCSDVQTPSGTVGHRCTCMDGMNGDGFAAGDGCYTARRLVPWRRRAAPRLRANAQWQPRHSSTHSRQHADMPCQVPRSCTYTKKRSSAWCTGT